MVVYGCDNIHIIIYLKTSHYKHYKQNMPYHNMTEEQTQKQKEWCKKYHDKVKDKLRGKHNCECGGRYTIPHKAKHFKSIKHQNFLKEL